MKEVPQNRTHASMWADLLQKKINHPDELLTAKDFDPILVNFPGGVSDFPAAIFGIDLIHAYPSAKVLITERDEDSWVESVMRTLVVGHKEAEHDREERLRKGEVEDELAEDRYRLRKGYHVYCWNDDFPKNGRAYWRKYQKDIRVAAKAQRDDQDVLVFDLKDGWAPLCKFIGKTAPAGVPFPHEGKGHNWSRKMLASEPSD
ncbi:hypothetical protein PWT90_03685 [Aphanocladium album]|nr:hypothetical protein PWT90_03685 [Aphanocladium album]